MIDFGDYVEIEQKRYGVDNEFYVYKVISGDIRSNVWIETPVDANNAGPKGHKKMEDIVLAICCGVCEEKVERFRKKDVRLLEDFGKRANKDFMPGT